MKANTVVRARINENIKKEASIVLSAMGLSISDAFRMLLTRIASEKNLPFSPLNPNEDTIKAIKEAQKGNLIKTKLENLLEELNAED